MEIESECAHSRRALHLTIDSELRWTLAEEGASPLLFEPKVDWERLEAPTIIDDF